MTLKKDLALFLLTVAAVTLLFVVRLNRLPSSEGATTLLRSTRIASGWLEEEKEEENEDALAHERTFSTQVRSYVC